MNTNERIRAYLDKIPPCIAGQGGDVHLYKVACVLFNGWALSEEETLVWLRVFNQRCQPPWDEYRLLTKREPRQTPLTKIPEVTSWAAH